MLFRPLRTGRSWHVKENPFRRLRKGHKEQRCCKKKECKQSTRGGGSKAGVTMCSWTNKRRLKCAEKKANGLKPTLKRHLMRRLESVKKGLGQKIQNGLQGAEGARQEKSCRGTRAMAAPQRKARAVQSRRRKKSKPDARKLEGRKGSPRDKPKKIHLPTSFPKHIGGPQEEEGKDIRHTCEYPGKDGFQDTLRQRQKYKAQRA